MKKILIFYAKYGGGHLSAAKSVKEYLEQNYPEHDIKLVDCMDYISHTVDKLTTTAYSEMAKKVPWAWGKIYMGSEKGLMSKISSGTNKIMTTKLYKLLKSVKPDLVICTHPFASQMVSYAKKHTALNCKLACVMTDFEIHKQYAVGYEYIDYYFVSNDTMKEELIKNNIDANVIHVTGIPISDRFTKKYNRKEILKEFELVDNKKTILFFGGGELGLGKEKTVEILTVLLKCIHDHQIIAISGKNEKMKNAFLDIKNTGEYPNLKILDYTNKIPELMSISDIVVTKPGGLTTSESLASGLPIIIINPIPGQEEQNANFLEKNNIGIWIRKDEKPVTKILDLFNNPDRIEQMKKNAIVYAKPNSTRDICNILMKKEE